MTKIYILAGQSNMAGAAATGEIPQRYRDMPGNIRLFEDGEWREMLWRDRFGPEVGFSLRLAELSEDDEIVLCKVATGGSNLYYDWNPDRTEGGPEDTYRGPLYSRLMGAVKTLADSIDSYEFAGALWLQGARDSVFEFMANSYADNLAAFIERLRRDVKTPSLPFIIGEIAPRTYNLEKGAFFHTHREIVKQAQRNAAATIPNTAFVEATDLPQFDNLHFDTAGQLILGRRLADAVLALRRLSQDG